MTSQTTAPAIIHKLVETFEQNLDSYRSSKNETELRREFLDKFFTALGWDVANEKGYDELGKEVIHEFSVDVAGQQKKADYAFRVGRGEKFDFLVEAKKPSVKVETSQEAAFQIRRYGWSAKLPINILSDFEHFAVYDCRTKPSYNDKASMGRIMLIHYKDYVSRWNEIVEIFSPEAVRKGSFAKYAEGMKGKKGTADVDDAFLQEIERWRELLAKNIALRNETIDIAGLNYSVQMTIDRIVFLRICEERGIEPENQLLEITNTDKVYEELCELFKRADTKYNSGLFHFNQEKEQNSRPDDLTLSLDIDDKILKDIISNLYYPKSPYAFLYIPSDILGQVYERFLGKVIRLTDGHKAKVEEKPEVRKAGGVFYTPTYIVDYIVNNTVGKFVENKSPKDVSSLKIVDPACGSGTFLLGAYQFLLDWHLNWYVENEPEKAEKNKAVVKVGDGYRLTTAKKKEILLNNIHGVDIDAQAVEVTKLSLLLKVLENASGQLGLGLERVLPDLGNNIKCGNSLVGFDYFEGQLLPDEEEITRINPFNWKSEFKEVFAKGGFDVVVGNPPYISVESTIKDVTEYYLKAYKTSYGRANTFALFIEKSFAFLKSNGLCGYIVSNRLLTNSQLADLRKFILDKSSLEKILAFKTAVFGAAVDTTVIIFKKDTPSQSHVIEIFHDITDLEKGQFEINKVSQTTFQNNASYLFNVRQREEFGNIISRIRQHSTELENICDVKDGIILGEIKDLLLSDTKKDNRYEKWLEGNEVSRYSIQWNGRYICYDKALVDEELKRKQQKAKHQAKTHSDFEKLSRSGVWLRNPDVFRQDKILTRQNAKRLIGVLDEGNNYFVKNSLHCSLLKDKSYNLRYVLGLINSRLMDFYFQNSIGNTGEIFSQMKIAYITKLPIHPINFSSPTEKISHDKMVSLVERVIELNKRLTKAKTPQEKEVLERQIQDTDSSIDLLVYELYGLNEEEIKIVEGQE